MTPSTVDATPDLFSVSLPTTPCPLCKAPYTAALGLLDEFWQTLAPKGPAHSEDACPNCVVSKLSDLHRYGVIRVAVLASDDTIDLEAHARRVGWLLAVTRLEEAGGSFLPMTTLLEMMQQPDGDGTITFASGCKELLTDVFKVYVDEFYKRVAALRAQAPAGGFEDRVVAEMAPTEGAGANG